MTATAVQQRLFDPATHSPTRETQSPVTASAAPSGPLADLVTALVEATAAIRSVEAQLAEAATDSSIGMRDLAAVIEAANHAGRAASGIETHAVAAFARRDEVDNETNPFADPVETVRGRGFVHDDTGLEIAHLLRISNGSGDTRARRAAALASRLPLTLAAVIAGDVELWQAHTILDETSLLTDDEARDADTWLHARLASTDPARLRAVARYAIGRVNPDAIRHRAAKTRADRRLEVTPALDQPGLSHLYALIPTHQAQAIWESASTLALEYQQLDPDLTADQARADAFVDLALADVNISAHVTLGMPIITSTTSGVGDAHDTSPPPPPPPPAAPDHGEPDSPPWPDPHDGHCSDSVDPIQPDSSYDGPGVAPDRIPDWMLNQFTDPGDPLAQSCPIDGIGPLAGTFTSGVTMKAGYIPADVIAALFTHLDLTVARALIDAEDGTVRETVTGAYRPTRKMREFVQLRDGTCRMYGCTRPAESCDIDHATPYDQGGPTSPTNTAALCRHHHRAKQARHWTYHLDPSTGVATWTNRRTGTVRQTAPATTMAAAERHRRAQEPELRPEPAAPVSITTSPDHDDPPPF